VLFRPEIVAVPFSSEMITGLCHLRSEFLAVVNLDGLLSDDAAGYLSERKMIVVNGPEGPWALLVDEVDVLAVLETNAVSDPGRRGDIVNAVVARAVHGSHVVQVLDPDRLYDAAGRDRSVEE
jgi:chemotaxis signal transduction protein